LLAGDENHRAAEGIILVGRVTVHGVELEKRSRMAEGNSRHRLRHGLVAVGDFGEIR
jgi:hypothetical protein